MEASNEIDADDHETGDKRCFQIVERGVVRQEGTDPKADSDQDGRIDRRSPWALNAPCVRALKPTDDSPRPIQTLAAAFRQIHTLHYRLLASERNELRAGDSEVHPPNRKSPSFLRGFSNY